MCRTVRQVRRRSGEVKLVDWCQRLGDMYASDIWSEPKASDQQRPVLGREQVAERGRLESPVSEQRVKARKLDDLRQLTSDGRIRAHSLSQVYVAAHPRRWVGNKLRRLGTGRSIRFAPAST